MRESATREGRGISGGRGRHQRKAGLTLREDGVDVVENLVEEGLNLVRSWRGAGERRVSAGEVVNGREANDLLTHDAWISGRQRCEEALGALRGRLLS